MEMYRSSQSNKYFNGMIMSGGVKIQANFTCIFEPRQAISNNVVCATSKGSVKPAHTRSIIRSFASRLSVL